MEKIVFDTGVREYALGNGVLRFHPGDPNLYARFLECPEKMQELEKKLRQDMENMDTEQTATAAVQLLQRTDRELKQLLGWVFGPENDFDRLLGGVNLLAIAENGERVIGNLLDALEPIILDGAEKCAAGQAQAAVDKANARRMEQ